MRVVQPQQLSIGEVDVSNIKFDIRSRDDIPRILKGLQFIYVNTDLRNAIFDLLQLKISPDVSKTNGRPGMTLWTIFVCGIIRLDLNIDYDRLHELVNQHVTLRAMLGHNAVDDIHYHLQTIKDNVRLLTPELLDEINQLIVKSGHQLVLTGSTINEPSEPILNARCDSFVVETDVHYPTDTNLLFDAMRKIIHLIALLCVLLGFDGWRQSAKNIKDIKQAMRVAQFKKQSKSKDTEKQKKNEAITKAAHQTYIDCAQSHLDKARKTLLELAKININNEMSKAKFDACKKEIEKFMVHADRQIDQIHRRVILEEKIPHEEKVFSLFETHTEWISKGKAGVPVELGVKVAIVEDQHGFILTTQVMEDQVDSEIAVEIVKETKGKFPNLKQVSFDKGFHSPENQEKLKEILDKVALPRKGKLSAITKAIEQEPEFIKARKAHSAVESAINALEVHGLDICPDSGIEGFKRYVKLAMVARNIHRIGDILWEREKEENISEMTKGKSREGKHAKNDEKCKPDKIAA